MVEDKEILLKPRAAGPGKVLLDLRSRIFPVKLELQQPKQHQRYEADEEMGPDVVLVPDEDRPCVHVGLRHPECLLNLPQVAGHLDDVLVRDRPVQLQVPVLGVPALLHQRPFSLIQAYDVGADDVVPVQALVSGKPVLVKGDKVGRAGEQLPAFPVRRLVQVFRRPVVAVSAVGGGCTLLVPGLADGKGPVLPGPSWIC